MGEVGIQEVRCRHPFSLKTNTVLRSLTLRELQAPDFKPLHLMCNILNFIKAAAWCVTSFSITFT